MLASQTINGNTNSISALRRRYQAIVRRFRQKVFLLFGNSADEF
jgi:hypothetical protein